MAPPSIAHRLAGGLATVPGTALRLTFGAVARIRPQAKPLHPEGTLRAGTVHRSGLGEPVGVPWIDEPGRTEVQLRLSRAIGFPDTVPDIHGLAMRIPLADGGHADLLLATTGLGRLTRFLLAPGRRPDDRSYSTLLPYCTPTGPLLLAATPRNDGSTFALSCARPRGQWQPFGYVEIAKDAQQGATGDISVAFDPVTNQLPGLSYYPWVRNLREGAYRAARRARGDDRKKP
jgi:hypothetical protein